MKKQKFKLLNKLMKIKIKIKKKMEIKKKMKIKIKKKIKIKIKKKMNIQIKETNHFLLSLFVLKMIIIH